MPTYGYSLYPPKPQFSDANGNPLTGGSVEIYEAGTATLATIYSDNPLVTPQTNPVTLNARGEPASPIFLDYTRQYKVVVKDSLGATIYTVDPFMVDTTNNGLVLYGSGTPEGSKTANVGTIYLRSNGGAGTTLYVKESGTGNTGWVGK